MPKRTALFVAAGAACAGALLLELYKQRLEEEISGGDPVPVLIATQDLAAGDSLTKSVLGVRQLPEAYVDKRHIRASEIEGILGARTSLGLEASESVLWTDLSTMELRGRELSGLVQEGMRAISVRADGFDGLLRPGDRVDVLFTAQGEDAEQSTGTLLQNVLVLAVGGRTQDDGEGSSFASGGRVTLSVTVDQARLLTQAQHRGTLRIILRNPDDIVLVDAEGQVSAADVTEPERRKRWQRRTPAPKRRIEHVQ